MKKIRTAIFVFKDEGVKGVLGVALEKIKRVFGIRRRFKIEFLVKNEDVINCNWDIAPRKFKTDKKSGPYTFNWVMHPPGKGSGGHQNLFRFIRFLEEAGHHCRIYLYTSRSRPSLEVVQRNISSSYTQLDASIEYLDGEMKEADAIFATGWETAYPVYNQKSDVKRFYFIQDFEPYFYTIGSEHALAENTYKFGFTGITAGRWLTSKLSNEYSMTCDYYDFGVDRESYTFENAEKRNKLFFYARPVTSRRGFELGVLALQKFHEAHPEIEILMAGWDVSEYEIPFPHKNLAVCDVKDLPGIYNECAAALILSFSNLSLLPLELLSCGVIPVINKGLNNEMVTDNDFLQYCEPAPSSLCAALSKVYEDEDQIENAKKAAQSVALNSWAESGKKFLEIIEREIHV